MVDFNSLTKQQKIAILAGAGFFAILLFFGCISLQNDAEVTLKAVENKNPTLCSTLAIASSVDACYSKVFDAVKDELTAEKCNEFGLKWKDTCFDTLGRTQLKSMYCNEIKNQSVRAECRNHVLQALEQTRFEDEKTDESIIIDAGEPEEEPETIEEPVLLTAEEVEKIVLEDLHFDAINRVSEKFYLGQPVFEVKAYQYRELTENTSTVLTLIMNIDAETGEKTGKTITISEKTIAFNKSKAVSAAKFAEDISEILQILYKIDSMSVVQWTVVGNRTVWETDRKFRIEKVEVVFDENGRITETTLLEVGKTQLSDEPRPEEE